jgi:hypothetical protein
LKNWIKYLLQRVLGFQNYLYVFALFKIRTLKSDSKEKDFFHFLSLLKDGKGDVLDVGANVGIMTVHLAQKLPNTTVHAIEPLPDNLRVLKRVVGHFGLNRIRIHETAVGESNGVPLNKLDDLINGQYIQGIKIDVENFEYYALKGGKRIIETNRPVIYAELWDNENRRNCLNLLEGLNYRSFVVVNDKLVAFDSDKHRNQNFIFLPN